MHRLLSILLIPMFMLGPVLPHTHGSVSCVEPSGHAIRPHIHVAVGHDHSHGHHGHSHHHDPDPAGSGDSDLVKASPSSTWSVEMDHDANAVYFPKADWSVTRSKPSPVLGPVVLVGWVSLVPTTISSKPRVGDATHPADRSARLPVYLLTASLRL